MKFKNINGRDYAEKLYIFTGSVLKNIYDRAVPRIRRLQRFIFLPYCYFFLVDWSRCDEGRWKVICDFLYIFFVLKDFPDNYYRCRLWEKDRTEWVFYYGSIYNPCQRYRLNFEVQKRKYQILYEDKMVCGDLCKRHGIPEPKNFGVFPPNSELNNKIHKIFSEQKEIKRLILKPLDGKGGHGIKIVELKGRDRFELVYPSGEKYEDIYECTDYYVVQECVNQHGTLNRLSMSVNTIRIVTMKSRDSDSLILGAYLRVGSGSSLVDNINQGGLAVKINMDSGVLDSIAYNKNGDAFRSHPVSLEVFDGLELPYWKEVLSLAKNIQNKMDYQKLLGMDIAITEVGPLLIEINSIYDNVGFEKVCGPILSNKLVWEEFKKYDLLFNKNQRSLYG